MQAAEFDRWDLVAFAAEGRSREAAATGGGVHAATRLDGQRREDEVGERLRERENPKPTRSRLVSSSSQRARVPAGRPGGHPQVRGRRAHDRRPPAAPAARGAGPGAALRGHAGCAAWAGLGRSTRPPACLLGLRVAGAGCSRCAAFLPSPCVMTLLPACLPALPAAPRPVAEVRAWEAHRTRLSLVAAWAPVYQYERDIAVRGGGGGGGSGGVGRAGTRPCRAWPALQWGSNCTHRTLPACTPPTHPSCLCPAPPLPCPAPPRPQRREEALQHSLPARKIAADAAVRQRMHGRC